MGTAGCPGRSSSASTLPCGETTTAASVPAASSTSECVPGRSWKTSRVGWGGTPSSCTSCRRAQELVPTSAPEPFPCGRQQGQFALGVEKGDVGHAAAVPPPNHVSSRTPGLHGDCGGGGNLQTPARDPLPEGPTHGVQVSRGAAGAVAADGAVEEELAGWHAGARLGPAASLALPVVVVRRMGRVDPPWTATPSFHLVWNAVSVDIGVKRGPRAQGQAAQRAPRVKVHSLNAILDVGDKSIRRPGPAALEMPGALLMVVRNVLRGVYSVGVTPRVSLLRVLPLAGPRKPTPPEEPAQSIRHGAVVVRSVGVLEVAIRGVSLRPLTPPSAVQGRLLRRVAVLQEAGRAYPRVPGGRPPVGQLRQDGLSEVPAAVQVPRILERLGG